MKIKPIRERICEAMDGKKIQYHKLATIVFPEDAFPRAWRSAMQGGPPGCYMALSRAIREMGLRCDGHGPHRIILPKK